MRNLAILLLTLCYGPFANAQAQPTQTMKIEPLLPAMDTSSSFIRHSWIASISFGFIDQYRQEFSVPAGFEKKNITGFTPIYGRAEYGLSNHMGLAGTIVYDEFYSNYYQLYTGNGKEFKRTRTDMTTIYSGGLSLNYHFASLIRVKRLDVFITAGFLLNNAHHSALPQGDSIRSFTDRTVTPVLKAGARYYISGKSSFFADAGFDKHSIISAGYSCRFMKKQ